MKKIKLLAPIVSAVALSTAATPLLSLTGCKKSNEPEIDAGSDLDVSKKETDTNGNLVITIAPKVSTKKIKTVSVKLGDYSATTDDYKYEDKVVTIYKAALAAHPGKITLTPEFEQEGTIVLNRTELVLGVGDTFQLTATATPAGTITWKSSDESKATVDSNGLVTAVVKDAEVIITASTGSASATCKLKTQMASYDYLTFTDYLTGVSVSLKSDVNVNKPETIIIPSKSPDSKDVIQIYDFKSNSTSKAIYIPNTVESVEEDAFDKSTTLAKFVIEDDNQHLAVGHNGAALYNKDKTSMYAYPSATGNIDLSSETTLTDIGLSFNGTDIVSMKLPESVEVLKYRAFDDCGQLTTFNFHKNLQLTKLHMPPFMRCHNLKHFIVDSNNPYYCVGTNDGVLLSKDKLKLVSYPSPTDEVDMNEICPDAISMGYGCMAYTKVKKIITTDNLLIIEPYALSVCLDLEEMQMGESLDLICPNAVKDMNFNGHFTFKVPTGWSRNNTDIEYPVQHSTVVQHLSVNGDSLQRFYTGNSYYNITFQQYGGKSDEYEISEVTKCDAIDDKTLHIPSHFETTFNDQGEISYKTVKSIGSKIFSPGFEGWDLEKIIVSSTVENISDYAFCSNQTSQCSSKITSYELNEGLKTIGSYAFNQCRATSITIPSTVQTIKSDAFKFSLIQEAIIKSPLVYGNYNMTYATGLLGGATNLYVPKDANLDPDFLDQSKGHFRKETSTKEGYDYYNSNW